MSDFVGKNVVVTGSNSGIGEATAIMYASRGANVTVCGRDAGRVQAVVEACQTAGSGAGYKNKVLGVPGEINKAACRTETLKKTVDTFGGLDVLVVNHAIAAHPPNLEAITEEIFDKQMDVNVKSVLFLIQEAMPHLEKSKGNVVVTSSTGSTQPNAVGMPYFVSKAAVDHMVRCLALELGPKGVRINAVNPTAVMTRLARDAETTGLPVADLFTFIGQSHPLGGRVSEPDEQAEAILFLSSSAARFITGVCLKVDGGISLKGNPIAFFFQNMMAQQQAS